MDGVLALCGARFGVLEDAGARSELEWGRLDGAGLRAAAVELQRVVSAVAHQQRRVLGLIDERRAFAVDGSRDVADWAAGRLGMSRGAAHEQVEVGRKLEALPSLAEKAAAGELSVEQAKPVVQLADAASDAQWAGSAPSMGVSRLQRRAARKKRPGAGDHVAARAARCFEAWRSGQELRFKGSVPVDDGARLLKAIERAMPDRDRDAPATLGQRQADGLLALAAVNVAADADPDRATVVVIAELAAICDDDPAATAELETGEPLATDTARRLVCDSRLSVLVQDPTGRAVGLGTTQRTVTPALRRALTVRDGGCRFGGCTATRFLHAHHIRHWPAPTEMGNLALVCFQHHHSLHEGGWRLTGDPFGPLTATHPDGRTSPPNAPRSADDARPPGRLRPGDDTGPPDRPGSAGCARPADRPRPGGGTGPPDRARASVDRHSTGEPPDHEAPDHEPPQDESPSTLFADTG